ncbi:MAG: hypothetical protein JST89_02480 [Cyanobacteria bacterium SZAS-4]|nr:hypothetical protein [Cyanobacteria bacterium SZAS-4]
MSVRARKTKGSSIVETAAGLILLIPIVLFLVDVAAMVVAQTENDKLAKACARAAAEFPSSNPGQQSSAAMGVYNNQRRSSLLTPTSLNTTNGGGLVTCATTITCTLPVPVPFLGNSSVAFNAKATEPIVGELP